MPVWIIIIGWITKLVLALLVGLSIWSVAIMRDRAKTLRAFESEDASGLKAGALKTAKQFKSTEDIDRGVQSFLSNERIKLEQGLNTLATLASNAPFIGLFGTVLGIIQAFGALAVQKSDTTMIMASISEALVATAVGLLVAIPAGIAYNAFSRRVKVLMTACEAVRDHFVATRN